MRFLWGWIVDKLVLVASITQTRQQHVEVEIMSGILSLLDAAAIIAGKKNGNILI